MDWNPIKSMPYQEICWVKNSIMKKPVLATRGHDTPAGVHPDNTFCTTVFTPDKMFPTPSGNLVCPDLWRKVEEDYQPEADINGDF